jgi:DNA-binding NtrC family response regulator
MQQQYLLRVLAQVGGNKAKAAEVLGVGRSTIYQILSRIRMGDGLKPDEYCQDPMEEMSN